MFDIGFSELLLIAVVALVVLGPERLPKAARLTGLWVRKARAQWHAVKAELENELADEELRRTLRAAADAAHDGAQQARALGDSLKDDLPSPRAAATAMPAETSHAAIQGDPLQHAPDAPASTEPVSIELPSIGAATIDYDPAQLSLLDPDPALAQMTALPTPSRPRSDG